MKAGALVGEYRILERLGAGGMGEVFRAVHCRLGRVVALKVLTPGAALARERFVNEARIQSALRHPNIATLFEFIEADGCCCLVMEYVDGVMLSSLIAAGALPPARTLAIFAPLVEAVDYLHQHGVVHRDIKASNVKINAAGQVKLLDFGIAQSDATPRLTQAGSVIGTLEYLSPEQLRGETATARSDIWALGVLLHEMTTGKLPFEASSVVELHEVVNRPPRLRPSQINPQLPRVLEAIILRCLRKKPESRYADTGELLQEVLAANASFGSEAENGKVRRTPAMLSAFVGGAALLVGGVLAFVSSGVLNPAQTPAEVSSRAPATNSAARNVGAVSESLVQNDDLHPVKIDVTGGRAEVFREGRLVGSTPYLLHEALGTKVSLVLRREGYREQHAEITVSKRKKTYSFLLEKE